MRDGGSRVARRLDVIEERTLDGPVLGFHCSHIQRRIPFLGQQHPGIAQVIAFHKNEDKNSHRDKFKATFVSREEAYSPAEQTNQQILLRRIRK